MKKVTKFAIIILCLCLAVGVGAFIYNAQHGYKINNGFKSVPLQFNPEDSSSSYQMKNAQITTYGGFIKGNQKNPDGTESLVIRALSPLPLITVTCDDEAASVSLIVENINPEFYAKATEASNLLMTKVTVNTLKFDTITISPGEIMKIEPIQTTAAVSTGQEKYVILGDNRDGYDTFAEIIQQVNGLNPVFVIDNGDLVFSGKPNQYRLFDKMVSTVASTLCTSPGNHDIRGNGREIYTMLYGPAYYSFDYADSHYVFLDSASGWKEKQAISDEQYAWLERDLAKAQGKQLFVITHIPPEDQRSGVIPNDIPNMVNTVKTDDNLLEEKLNSYYETKNMNHGFSDPQEAEKFENIMSTYHVNTVYLSHIHSYMEYTRDGVRYLITGGAGAELLTKDSYYHYMIAKIGAVSTTTMVELPSPANTYISRYLATAKLFAEAMYEENPVTVILISIGFVILVFLVIFRIYIWKQEPIDTLGKWLRDTGSFAAERFRELFQKKNR